MYTLKPLPFEMFSLEPFIDTHTIGLHHYRHELSYLNNLNKILAKYNLNNKYRIDELYNHLNEFKDKDKNDLIFYLGGVTNHELYWQSINPHNKENPKGKLLDAIKEKFGSFDNMWNEFKNLVTDLKGSGYIFLAQNKDNQLELISTSNQDSPYLFNLFPLFCIDFWEHAYYINYENDKLNYFENFKILANFNYANKNFN